MTLLPSGLVVPPLPYLVALGVLTVAVVVALSTLEPVVDQQVVLGAVPWMVLGAFAHVFYQLERVVDVYPSAVEPLAAAPTVYVSTFLAFSLVWLGLTYIVALNNDSDRVGIWLAATGTAAVVILVGFAGTRGAYDGAKPYWSLIGLLMTLPLTALVYAGLAYWRPSVTSRAGPLGLLAVFAHAFDGVTTTVGVDILNRAERSPLPDRIMEFAGTLPTEPWLGTGWLFVVVKLVVAVAIVVAFADYLEERPTRGNLMFGAIVVFGLGPAVNNFLLFTLRDVGGF